MAAKKATKAAPEEAAKARPKRAAKTAAAKKIAEKSTRIVLKKKNVNLVDQGLEYKDGGFNPYLNLVPIVRGGRYTKMQIERKVRLVTEQKNIPKESPMPEFPMKEWSVKLYLLDQDGNKHPANCFTKVLYNLHPSFDEPQQTFHEPPFTCTNEGWGEFEMSIDMYTTEKAKITIFHDLNFQSPEYKNDHTITFKNPSQALIQVLRETGPVGDDDNKGAKARKGADGKKRKYNFDFEKMADAMTKLNEDDLLHVIQMIHDHKSDDTVTNNDIERGEFSIDLFTMPDSLAKMIWEFLLEQKMVTP